MKNKGCLLKISALVSFICAIFIALMAFNYMSEAKDSPYHSMWPFLAIVSALLMFTGYVILKPSKKLLIISVLGMGLLLLYFVIMILMWMTAILNNAEALLYIPIMLIPSALLTLLLIALNMRYQEMSHGFTGKKVSENVARDNVLDEDGAKIYKGNKYISQKDKEGEAFCLGCRSVDVLNNLYYCRETDQYYHEKCIGINN